MRLTTELNVSIDVKILGKPVFKDEIQIGKITDSYIKDEKLWAIITLDSKKIKQFKNLLKALTIIKEQ